MHVAKTAGKWGQASASHRATSYYLQSSSLLVSRNNMPGEDILHATFAVVKPSQHQDFGKMEESIKHEKICQLLKDFGRIHKLETLVGLW